MLFRILGPLDWNDDGRTIRLGGIKQRATLGSLLLQPNRVISTSGLVDALWAGEDPPVSARKMLQNAVWSLRGHMASTSGQRVSLQTERPGYVLRVAPEEIDLFRFRDLVAKGQEKLAANEPGQAVKPLRDALGLWRGPVLADLVDAGLVWPELVSIQNARPAAMEDLFEAELRCGRHYMVLSDLEALVEAEPFRERAVAQLMLALHRCGRQADALSVYSRFRTVLVGRLGLDPGPELQALQQAILEQSPTLAIPGHAKGARAAVTTGLPHDEPDTDDGTVWRQDSGVLMRVDLCPDFGGTVNDVMADVDAIIREETERSGGSVAVSIDSLSLMLFDDNSRRQDQAERAVQAAMAIRDRVASHPNGHRFSVYTAVATGETLVNAMDKGRHPKSSAPVSGALMIVCQGLLARTERGEIRVCDETKKATSEVIALASSGDGVGWRVAGRPEVPCAVPGGHDYELVVLESLLSRMIHRRRPHLVSILGRPGSGKTRFLAGFENRVDGRPIGDEPEPVQVLRTSPFAGTWGLLTRILEACSGIQPADRPGPAKVRPARTVREVLPKRERAVASLSLLLEPGSDRQVIAHDCGEAISVLLRDRPTVVIIDDLHLTDDALLRFVEDLPASIGAAPLMVVAAGKPELLQRCPEWGGGKPYVTTVMLDAARVWENAG